MKANEVINELRRNPKHNPPELIGDKGALTWIKNNIARDQYKNYGVSLTQLPKLGINPTSRYNTPVGVYFYPLDFYVAEVNLGREMPFPENPKYINIFRINADPSSILNLDNFSQADFDSFIDILRSRFREFVAAIPEAEARLDDGQEGIDFLIDSLVEDAYNDAKIDTPGGRFWYIMWNLSNYVFNVPSLRKKTRKEEGQASRASIIWNWLSRQLGISAYLDTESVIHENEPVQGVVVNPQIIELVKTLPASKTERLAPPSKQKSFTLTDTIKNLSKILKQKTDKNYHDVIRKYVKYFNYLYSITPQDEKIILDQKLLQNFYQNSVSLNDRNNIIVDDKIFNNFLTFINNLLLNNYQYKIKQIVEKLPQIIAVIQQMSANLETNPGYASANYNRVREELRSVQYNLSSNIAAYNKLPKTSTVQEILNDLTNIMKSTQSPGEELKIIIDQLTRQRLL